MAPNHLLRNLLAESGWTGQTLAKNTNRLGAEAGLRLRYDRTSVAHWLSGMRPRPPVPELVAEAFSRHLGRRITAKATGLERGATVTSPPWWRNDVTAELTKLCQDGAANRRTISGCAYSLAALSVPGWGELANVASSTRRTADTGKIERADLEAARTMLELFSTADLTFGGGHVRPALAHYLRTTIAPWLRSGATPAVRTDMLTTAAQLSYLCGFLCFDDELHGVAQRYYLIAARLSHEAGDALHYAIALRALSVQARMLGHRALAVDLATTAARALPGHAPAITRAFLTGQVAVAEAAAHDQHQAVAHLRAAENYLDHAEDSAPPVGTYHPAALSHHHAAVRACLGERHAAVSALTHSLRHRPATERRARAITLARLAELHLDAGELDRACHVWEQFLEEYPYLRSQRADTALSTLRARLRPHSGYPLARSVTHKANEVRCVAA
ncbi:tol-pal system YbgF family protein [Amycolatopsis azurea]|uniref:tetratricopeptide repeat protein n=1 Tax=Amycolatopsis azurea TaxID=36819 RepID=UPI0038184CC3